MPAAFLRAETKEKMAAGERQPGKRLAGL